VTEKTPQAMRLFHLQPGLRVQELDALPGHRPHTGFLWLACTREHLGAQLGELQATLQALTGQQLVDLHVSDLLNAQLPSHYDYTSEYDLMVFRRLSATEDDQPAPAKTQATAPVLRRIRTSPVGFAVFDHVVLSVHPQDCMVRDTYAARLMATSAAAFAGQGDAPPPLPVAPPLPQETTQRDSRNGAATAARLPSSPADLMLRVVNLIVDNYLDLRRDLSRQLDHWQIELLKPRARALNWSALLEARLSLHQLDSICEDQRAALQDWVDMLETWEPPDTSAGRRERDLLMVRSRDVLEHIERVVHHVRRLEQSAETAVQMHFSVQSNRTNDIMRTLTAITAVFLPLNLIAAIFGMNFEFIPLVHKQDGFWWAMGAMLGIALSLIVVFWRKRYLARTSGH
jgi:magnesium transporter